MNTDDSTDNTSVKASPYQHKGESARVNCNKQTLQVRRITFLIHKIVFGVMLLTEDLIQPVKGRPRPDDEASQVPTRGQLQARAISSVHRRPAAAAMRCQGEDIKQMSL